MNSSAKHESNLDFVLSWVLRIGLGIAFIIVFIGGSLFLWQHANDHIDYKVFNGQFISLKGIKESFESAVYDHYLGFIQLGILLLIATPIVRVIFCMVIFAIERDMLYVSLSGVVLIILLFSFLS